MTAEINNTSLPDTGAEKLDAAARAEAHEAFWAAAKGNPMKARIDLAIAAYLSARASVAVAVGVDPRAEALYEFVRSKGFHGPDAKPWADRSQEHQALWIEAASLTAPVEETVEPPDIARAANALLNNLWAGAASGVKSHEENWTAFERRYPGVKWLHDALRASAASPSIAGEEAREVLDSDGTALQIATDDELAEFEASITQEPQP